MTSTGRPLLRITVLVSTVVLATWMGLVFFSSTLLGLIATSTFVLYVGLVLGAILIPRPGIGRRPTKVFCIGLSRTGTTSLSVALDQLGYSTYHTCFKLLDWPNKETGRPRVNTKWADAFDAQSDAPPATVYRELADLYPTARFILTTREARAWSESMTAFVRRYGRTFRLTPYPPVNQTFKATYGPNWETQDVRAYAEVYERHVREVRQFFSERRQESRLLELAITSGEGWEKLLEFLGRDTRAPVDFPHVDVFDLTWNKQPWWQLRNLVGYFRLRRRGGTSSHTRKGPLRAGVPEQGKPSPKTPIT